MIRGGVLLIALLALTGCATGSRDSEPSPTRAADFKPGQIRQPAVFVRVVVNERDVPERERTRLAADYEGALLEGLNTRAVLVRDVQVARPPDPRVDAQAALARAREVQADHAVLVDVQVVAETVTVCQETRRPRRGQARVWKQDVEVIRVSDGATQLRMVNSPLLAVSEVDIDCDDPQGRARRRGPAEIVTESVDRLLKRLLGS